MIPKSKAVRFFFVLIFTLFLNYAFGQSGKDGVKTINLPNTVVNDYTTLTLDVASGSTLIQVANNSLNAGFLSPISTGDLVFIIQVQGATISSLDDSTYGSVLSYQNCGNFEFAEVSAISGPDGIIVSCPLRNSYSAAGKTMVIRVPRYSVLTVNGGGSITCPSWNGLTGGVIAIEVYGVTMINGGGSIDASGKGFRGGTINNTNSWYGVGNYKWTVNTFGAEKGESVSGFLPDYDLLGGRYCKGAPANGGGGGNAHNAGGGGGANAGVLSAYTGRGNPDNSNASWAAAWNLESPGFALSTSSGGGKGGYTFSSSNQNALTTGPNNSAWGGDNRDDNGGRGGHPLDYATGKIFIGGGGGAGEENDSKGGSGGNGGGIIAMLCYADISGSGQIASNGANGFSTSGSNGTDGAGGGGGGGAILLNTTGTVSGISVNANGGNGGSQSVSVFTLETEGPGGGGGGGYISISNGTPTRSALGGNNGTTNCLSLTEFPPNGATKGGRGIDNATLPTFQLITQPVNLCSAGSAILTFTVQGTPPPGVTYNWFDQPFGGSVLGTGTTFTTSFLSASKTFYVGFCPGTLRTPVQVNVSTAPTAAFSSSVVCAGSPTSFSSNGSAGISSWNWNFGNGSGTSTLPNPSFVYTSGGTYNVTLTVSDGVCSSSTTQPVIVSSSPAVAFTSSGVNCGNLNVLFTNNTTPVSSGYTWNFGDGSPLNTQASPQHTFSSPGLYNVILTATGTGCTGSDTVALNITTAPSASFSTNTTICQNDTAHFVNLSQGNGSAITGMSWDFGDGSSLSTLTNPVHVYNSNGTFNVRLIASSAACTDDTVIAINVNTAPIANFTATSTSGCPPLNINFTNNTTGTPQYFWNFGDGSPVSTQTSPSHNYTTPGTYNLQLIASQGSCSDTLIKPGYIVVSGKPLSSFTTSAVCIGDSAHFINTSSGTGITSYHWNFGDGDSSAINSPSHYYASPGTYPVTLTCASSTCTDDTTISIQVNPIPVANFSVSHTQACDTSTIQFTNLSSAGSGAIWNFGDGATSSVFSPDHFYSSPGNYSITLQALSAQGCSSSRTALNLITIDSKPSAAFTCSAQNICSGNCVDFFSPSAGAGTSWQWIFSGAGTSSASAQNPGGICYPAIGSYNVTLNVSDGICTGSHTETSYIHVVDCSVKPKSAFILSDTSFCMGSCISFVDLSTNAISWNWSFPGAVPSGSSLENPSNICYLNPGHYPITLITGNSAGTDTMYLNNFIYVSSAPGTPLISIAGNILNCSSALQYQWYFNNVAISGATSQQYTAPLTGDYSVVTTDANGCTASSSVIYVPLVGIDTAPSGFYFYVYPNPANNEIFVMISDNNPSDLTIKLFDDIGRELVSKYYPLTSGTETINFKLFDLSKGVYFLHLISGNRRWVRPIIKN